MATTNTTTGEPRELELEARLEDRERLVEELTSRLEQAAEQLDRHKRTGADRSGRITGGGLPPELVEQQQTLTEELRQAVQNWEDMQPTLLLSRLEMQLGELRDVMHGGIPAAAPATNGGAPVAATPPPAAPTPPPADDVSGLSTYELFKAGLAADDSSATPLETPPAEVAEAPAEPEVTTDAETIAEPRPPMPVIPEVDPPEAIDLDEADEQTLRAAIDQRDSYIVYLMQRLRAYEVAQWPAGDWKDLEGIPGELTVRLEEYEKQLEEMLRLAEVETSLERARLGREAAKLEQQRHQIQAVMAQFELDAQAEADDEAIDGEQPQNGKARTKPSRLKRFLTRWQGEDE